MVESQGSRDSTARSVFACVFWSALLLPAIVFAQQPNLTTSNAARYRGEDGRRITLVCAAGFKPGGVWGTDVYTDDSSICSAAAHAGLIRPESGGVVTAVLRSGSSSYKGSRRNGITSGDYGPGTGSFTVEKGDGGQIDWSTRVLGLSTATGPVALVCPPSAKGELRVWGTSTYTDDSPICAAAVHAGLITQERGGKVVVEAASGLSSYRGTSRNGVTSQAYGHWPRGFRFKGVAEVAEAPAATPVIPKAIPAKPSVPIPHPTLTSPRTISAPGLDVTGMAVQSLSRSITSSSLVVSGTAIQVLHRTITTAPLEVNGK